MDDPKRSAIAAAVNAICDAAEPFGHLARSPAVQSRDPGSIVLWAIGGDLAVTRAQVETLADAFGLIALACATPASDARH